MDATTEAVQIHGSRGYRRDYAVERYMREAKGTYIHEGTNEVNCMVITNHMCD
jgi:alkylation response protein AidB-like acyl-CoA dehydrogenase